MLQATLLQIKGSESKDIIMRNKTKRRRRKLDLATDSGTTHVFIASSLPGQKFTSVVLLARETTFIDSSDDTVTCSHNEPDDHDEPTDPDRSTSSETPELRNLLDSIKKRRYLDHKLSIITNI